MRYALNPQQRSGQAFIQDIVLDIESRDDIVPALLGIQLLHSNATFMAALMELPRSEVQPHVDRGQDRPGMDLRAILVLGLVKQASGFDYDRLHSLANSHDELRRLLGHSDIRDRRWYRLRALTDNVNLLVPELFAKISHPVAEHAHAMAGKAPLQILFGRGDSFVAKPTSASRRIRTFYGTRSARAWAGRRAWRRSMKFPAGENGRSAGTI